MFTANYHTHTYRCNHAVGTEREYIECAINAGLKTLGFSDHCPQIFPNGYESGFRMLPQQVEDYFSTLSALKEEYADRIDIKIGFEAEYYPAFFQDLLNYLEPYPCDYLILGQHFMENELSGRIAHIKTDKEQDLTDYVNQVCEAMRTGKFTYLAHPDILCFQGDDDIFRREYEKLFACSRETAVPLEINFLGIRENRHYPNEKFWSLAAQKGVDVVFGCDAHSPKAVADIASYNTMLRLVKQYQLHLVEPTLRPLS